MARKQDEEDLLAQLDALSSEQPSAPTTSTTTTNKPAPKAATATSQDDDGALALEDIQAQLAAKRAQPSQQISRPSTPRLSSSTTSGTNKSPKRAEHTPASSGPPSGRTSEDRLRTTAAAPTRSSGEGRVYHQSSVPGEEAGRVRGQDGQGAAATIASAGGSGGGWWGSMFSAATAAVSQAQNLAKEITANEEAQKWAEQVRGYGAGLQSFSTDIRSRALPTFTTLISHIAPPISAHERLQIHTTHDILNYPSLDPLIYSTFSRIMSQVEGGDLLVLQRGSESRSRATSEPRGYKGGVLGSGGWADGPWWRDESQKRDLGIVPGLKEGTRLARVSAESYAKEFFDARGGVEEAAKIATETLSESNPVRSSDIFLAIQAVGYEGHREFFAGGARDDEKETNGKEGGVVDPEETAQDLVCFAVYLHDPLHSLSFSALSQPFPRKWADWLDAVAATTNEGADGAASLPQDILNIIETGGVDPREWVAEWMEEILSLGVGVVAQRYVARRMGVGEGGLGRGKRRAEEEGIGGEAARAV